MGRVGRSGGGWGGVEKGREEWGKECLASHRPQHLWLFLPLSNRASISLTLLHVSPIFLWRIIRIFTFPLPPPLPTLIQLALFTLSSLILLSSPTSPLPWFPFLSHSTTRAHELKTSKACPNNTLDVTADSCTEIRH